MLQPTALSSQEIDRDRRRRSHARSGLVALRTDHARERTRQHASPLLAAYSADRRRRPHLATFVASLSVDEPVVRLEVAPDNHNRPDWRVSRYVELRSGGGGDLDVIHVGVTGSPAALDPDRLYWVRHADDRASRIALERQIRARPGLELRPTLVSKLRHPVSMEIRRPRWQDVDPRLQGDTPQVVQDVLAAFPIHAVQGPPGSGKTTVATEALRLYLTEEPAARVLVSAQSHYALDNIGTRIIEKLAEASVDGHVVREIPNNFDLDRLPTPMRQHTIGELTAAAIRQIRNSLDVRLNDSGPITSVDRKVLTEWRRCVETNEVEIAHRLRRSAAVVLATCSTAAARFSEATDPAALFDWVLVEEAAKAWPTELVMPLLLAPKWTLIGDHKQLGAYRSEDVEAFLASMTGDPDDDLVLHSDRLPLYRQVLDLFGSMFDLAPDDGLKRATSRLTLQFRMHEAIADPVSRAFYPVHPPQRDEIGPLGFLETFVRSHPEHPFAAPPLLVGHPLVWIDTTGDPRCGDDPYWYNDGEVALVSALFGSLRPAPALAGTDDAGSVAILTPYRQQLARLEKKLGRGRIHTVHSFQGREADCTIVSLVRDRQRGDDTQGNLGHVDKPELVNVLLSRARRLNVLVGSFGHFATFGSEHWRTVCRVVEARGRIVPSQEVS